MERSANENRQQRNLAFSKVVRAGRRTYFFDVQPTRSDELYLTITESKKKFSEDQSKFFYEKHKLFLYREDFEKFSEGLSAAMEYIARNPEGGVAQAGTGNTPQTTPEEVKRYSDVSFEELGGEGERQAAFSGAALEEEKVSAG